MLTRRQYLRLSALGLTGLASARTPQGGAIAIKDDRPTVLMGDGAILKGG
jgi:hypothetical protein